MFLRLFAGCAERRGGKNVELKQQKNVSGKGNDRRRKTKTVV
jgi:hypothetical protein